eukprot:755962-Hanusia_phi.AAC.2
MRRRNTLGIILSLKVKFTENELYIAQKILLRWIRIMHLRSREQVFKSLFLRMSANVLRNTLKNWYDKIVSGSQNSKWSPDDLLISSRYSKAPNIRKSMSRRSAAYGEMPSLKGSIETYDFWGKQLVRMKNIVARKADFWSMAWDMDGTEENIDAANFIKAVCQMQIIRRVLMRYRESFFILGNFFRRSHINRKFVEEETKRIKRAATLIQKRIRGILGRKKAMDLSSKMKAILDSILLKKDNMAIGQKVLISPHLFYPSHKLNKTKGKILRKEMRQGTIVKIIGDKCRIFFDHVLSELKFGEYKYSQLLLLKDVPKPQEGSPAGILSPRLLAQEIVQEIVDSALREIGYNRRGRYTYRPRKKADAGPAKRPASWYGSTKLPRTTTREFKSPYMMRKGANNSSLTGPRVSLSLSSPFLKDSLFLNSKSATLHPSPRVSREAEVPGRYNSHLQHRY